MEYLQLFLSLVGVLGLIFLLFFALRKLNKRVSVSTGSKMRVLDRVNLGRDSMLLVVSVCGKLMVMGVTSQRIDKICDLDIAESDYLPSAVQNEGFANILNKFVNKNDANKNDANQNDANKDEQKSGEGVDSSDKESH